MMQKRVCSTSRKFRKGGWSALYDNLWSGGVLAPGASCPLVAGKRQARSSWQLVRSKRGGGLPHEAFSIFSTSPRTITNPKRQGRMPTTSAERTMLVPRIVDVGKPLAERGPPLKATTIPAIVLQNAKVVDAGPRTAPWPETHCPPGVQVCVTDGLS